MPSLPRSDPDNRIDVRASPKLKSMTADEYMGHVAEHSREWFQNSMHRQILGMINTDVFFMMEDDSLPQPDAVIRLLELLDSDPDCVMASGVLTHRCPGLHKMGITPAEEIEWQDDMIIMRKAFNPETKGVVEAKATGFYCFAAKIFPYIRAFNEAQRRGLLMTYIGHDIVVTNVITQLGGKVLVDFGVWGGHMQKHSGGIYTFTKKDAVWDYYVWNEKELHYDNILLR
jgi:hypothetical protein